MNNPVPLKSKLLLALVVIISLVIPIQFWRGVWFGRALSLEEIRQALSDTDAPRRVQHALSQIDDRIVQNDPEVEQLYSLVTALKDHPRLEVRLQAAWVMGRDPESREFHQGLLVLLKDSQPLVRRNAALSLTRFSDARALPELRGMLEPFSVKSPLEGLVVFLVRRGEAAARGTELARVEGPSSGIVESPLPGRILDLGLAAGESITRGESLLSLAPEPEHVWEALRALFFLGGREELPLVQRFVEDQGYSDQLRKQAENTARAIRERLEQGSGQ